MTTKTYAVYSIMDNSVDAETDLSALDVVRHIYGDDGGGYRLEPKMLTFCFDEDDKELPDTQATNGRGEEIFEIWFKNNRSSHYRLSPRTAVGIDEEAAEEAFLQESFNGRMWRTNHWLVVPTEQYQEEQKEPTQCTD